MPLFASAGCSFNSPLKDTNVRTAILSILIILAGQRLRAQDTIPGYDPAIFSHQQAIARWCYDYEEIAGLAADTLRTLGKPGLTRLETTGFCYQESSGKWHILYGTFKNQQFHSLFHFSVDSGFITRGEADLPDTSLVQPCIRALMKASELVNIEGDSAGIHLSQYVRILPDKSVEVFIFPAFQPSGQAVYGVEWEFVFSPRGNVLLNASGYQSAPKGVWIGQPRELWLNYRNTDFPTVGSLFFSWSFKDFFKRIHIDTRLGTFTLSKNSSGWYEWKNKPKNNGLVPGN